MKNILLQKAELFNVAGSSAPADHGTSPVSIHNEWDSLKEVIVGTIETAKYPTWHVSVEAPLPRKSHQEFIRKQGQVFDPDLLDKARREVDGLAEFCSPWHYG